MKDYKDKIVDFFANYKYKKIAFEQVDIITSLREQLEDSRSDYKDLSSNNDEQMEIIIDLRAKIVQLEGILYKIKLPIAPYQKQVGKDIK